MITSDAVNEISPAWVEALNELTTVAKDSDGHFGRYATLTAVLALAKPTLAKHGLAVQQYPRPSETGTVTVVTRLWHTSGQWLEDDGLRMPAPNDPQKVGGAVTYARRFALTAFLSLTADDDDDGQTVSEQIRKENEPHPNSDRVAEVMAEMKALDQAGRADVKLWANGHSLAAKALLDDEGFLTHLEDWLAEYATRSAS